MATFIQLNVYHGRYKGHPVTGSHPAVNIWMDIVQYYYCAVFCSTFKLIFSVFYWKRTAAYWCEVRRFQLFRFLSCSGSFLCLNYLNFYTHFYDTMRMQRRIQQTVFKTEGNFPINHIPGHNLWQLTASNDYGLLFIPPETLIFSRLTTSFYYSLQLSNHLHLVHHFLLINFYINIEFDA